MDFYYNKEYDIYLNKDKTQILVKCSGGCPDNDIDCDSCEFKVQMYVNKFLWLNNEYSDGWWELTKNGKTFERKDKLTYEEYTDYWTQRYNITVWFRPISFDFELFKKGYLELKVAIADDGGPSAILYVSIETCKKIIEDKNKEIEEIITEYEARPPNVGGKIYQDAKNHFVELT